MFPCLQLCVESGLSGHEPSLEVHQTAPGELAQRTRRLVTNGSSQGILSFAVYGQRMSRHGGSYDVRYYKRDARQRRLRYISYVALAALAIATIGVVLMAVER